jgi:RES domain-containing protein
VEYRFTDPNEVLSGVGTELYGGRFASVGTRAVYLSETDATAGQEILARKKRLGGVPQITLDKYPRIVWAVTVDLERVVSWIRKPHSSLLAQIRSACLTESDLSASQDLGARLRDAGIGGLLFASAVAAGNNLIVYKNNCGPLSLVLLNAEEMRKKAAEIAKTVAKLT